MYFEQFRTLHVKLRTLSNPGSFTKTELQTLSNPSKYPNFELFWPEIGQTQPKICKNRTLNPGLSNQIELRTLLIPPTSRTLNPRTGFIPTLFENQLRPWSSKPRNNLMTFYLKKLPFVSKSFRRNFKKVLLKKRWSKLRWSEPYMYCNFYFCCNCMIKIDYLSKCVHNVFFL